MVTSINEGSAEDFGCFFGRLQPLIVVKIERIEQERREAAEKHHLEKRSKKGLCKKMGSL
jgi:hypothetical protein